MSKMPDFEEIWSLIDYSKVEDALWDLTRDGKKSNYSLDEVNNIHEMVESAARHWLPRDLVELNIGAIEEKATFPLDRDTTIKGYIDIVAQMRGTMKPFSDYKDKIIIIDWKTRDGELDQRWRERLIDSWQWKIYSTLVPGTAVVSYRGVSRRCGNDGCGTKEVLLGVHRTCHEEVIEQCNGLIRERNVLIERGLPVWPRNMPDACFKYGYECPFKQDCDKYTMPRFVPNSGREMSYTSFGYFMRCPEFSRRMEGDPGADDTEESNIGGGFHRCIAEVYRQVKEIKLV